MASKKCGLYCNIHKKRKRIAAGSGEKMRKAGSKGAPTAANFKRSAKTVEKVNTDAVGGRCQHYDILNDPAILTQQRMTSTWEETSFVPVGYLYK